MVLDLDGTGTTTVSTGLPFFDHMLDQLGRHGGFDLAIKAVGDLEVDAHHTIEDTSIVLGEALAEALGDKAGVRRFASGLYPLDEALVEVALDLSGRPYVGLELLKKHGEFTLNVPDAGWVQAFDHIDMTAADKADKFEVNGLTRLPSKLIGAPGIAEAAIVLECKQILDKIGLPPFFWLGHRQLEGIDHSDKLILEQEENDLFCRIIPIDQ